MTRAYTGQPVAPETVDHILDLARRGPSAGKTESLHFLVLEGGDVARYWNTTLAPEKRPSFPWPQLLDAPALIVPWVEPGAYVRRYAEPDKATTGLGATEDAWSVPYWWVDGGAAAMTVLLAVEDAGLGRSCSASSNTRTRSGPSSACRTASERSARSPSGTLRRTVRRCRRAAADPSCPRLSIAAIGDHLRLRNYRGRIAE